MLSQALAPSNPLKQGCGCGRLSQFKDSEEKEGQERMDEVGGCSRAWRSATPPTHNEHLETRARGSRQRWSADRSATTQEKFAASSVLPDPL